jgi:hypothetical protein
MIEMNRYEKNRIAVACICTGMIDLFRRDRTPATVENILTRIAERGQAVTLTLPDPTADELRAVRNRVLELTRLFTGTKISPLVLSSFLLAIVENATPKAEGETRRAFIALHTAVRHLHTYYDRNLRHFDQYRQAANLADRWQQAI